MKKFLSQPPLTRLANILFYTGFAVSIGTLVHTYLSRRNLPPNVCPVDANTHWFYIAIGLLSVSFVLSFVGHLKKL